VAYDGVVPTRANGQPAFGALFVLTLTGDRICAARGVRPAIAFAIRLAKQ